jgi:hypothetical protein
MDEQDISLRKWLVLMGILAEVGQMWLILVQAPTPTQIQHHPHGPDDAFRTIKHPLLDISGHDGIDEQNISLRKCLVLMGISAGSWANVADSCSSPNPYSNSAPYTWAR